LEQELKARLVVSLISLAIGVAIGLAVNVGWYIFSGFFLGWGDSAPEWYFNIQNYVQSGIIIFSAAFCVIFANIYFFPKEP